jgi:hypothetical protein
MPRSTRILPRAALLALSAIETGEADIVGALGVEQARAPALP